MKHTYILLTASVFSILVGGLFFAEKFTKAERPRRKNFPNEPPKEKAIGIYSPVVPLKKSWGVFFAALFGAFPIFIVSLTKIQISLAIIGFVIFTAFFYLLFLALNNFHYKLHSKLIIYPDGISSMHRVLGKRIYMPFSEIITANYDDFSDEIQINGQNQDAEPSDSTSFERSQ